VQNDTESCEETIEQEPSQQDDYDDDDTNFVSEATYQAASPALSAMDAHGSDMGVKQIIDSASSVAVVDRIRAARAYVNNVVNVDPSYKEETRRICKNQHESCAFWATVGTSFSALVGQAASVKQNLTIVRVYPI
jgi:hypothetical protein